MTRKKEKVLSRVKSEQVAGPEQGVLEEKLSAKDNAASEENPQVDLRFMAERWPSGIVARQCVEAFSGGILRSKTLANEDSEGIGPKERFRMNRKVFYTVDALIKYMEQRTTRLG